MTFQTRNAIQALLDHHDILPRKGFGQHFLADANLVRKVVEVAGVGSGDAVVEVGAGTGALTAGLAASGAKVVAYEVDERLRPVLAESLSGIEVDLRFADVMAVDLSVELAGEGWKLVANLPYNVGTPLVLDVLLEVPSVVSLTVMLQKEVADRLVASPGGHDYGVPSVIVSLTGEVVERFTVPPQVFVPVPQVQSSVLRIDRRPPPAALGDAVELARMAFGQRRKMLRRSMAGRLDDATYAAAGIEPTTRPEQLTPDQFVQLAEAVAND